MARKGKRLKLKKRDSDRTGSDTTLSRLRKELVRKPATQPPTAVKTTGGKL